MNDQHIVSNVRSLCRAGIVTAAILLALPASAAPTPSPKPKSWAEIQGEVARINARLSSSQREIDLKRAKADAARAKVCAHRTERGAVPNYDADAGCDAINVKVTK